MKIGPNFRTRVLNSFLNSSKAWSSLNSFSNCLKAWLALNSFSSSNSSKVWSSLNSFSSLNSELVVVFKLVIIFELFDRPLTFWIDLNFFRLGTCLFKLMATVEAAAIKTAAKSQGNRINLSNVNKTMTTAHKFTFLYSS